MPALWSRTDFVAMIIFLVFVHILSELSVFIQSVVLHHRIISQNITIGNINLFSMLLPMLSIILTDQVLFRCAISFYFNRGQYICLQKKMTWQWVEGRQAAQFFSHILVLNINYLGLWLCATDTVLALQKNVPSCAHDIMNPFTLFYSDTLILTMS